MFLTHQYLLYTLLYFILFQRCSFDKQTLIFLLFSPVTADWISLCTQKLCMCCVASPDIDLDNIDSEKIEWRSNKRCGAKYYMEGFKRKNEQMKEAVSYRQSGFGWVRFDFFKGRRNWRDKLNIPLLCHLSHTWAIWITKQDFTQILYMITRPTNGTLQIIFVDLLHIHMLEHNAVLVVQYPPHVPTHCISHMHVSWLKALEVTATYGKLTIWSRSSWLSKDLWGDSITYRWLTVKIYVLYMP